ncbi:MULTISPECIES: type II secretion system F family protein [unclassified Oceanobacter]|uniref:type II secretion system F family protein n=1 Tax=unclassified Oceanobacter TaxID=2620260 RepID=UPI0026E2AD91|nr:MULTISPECIES: type II secretion system F family protein [unclassified Oceanobacter]MDO6681484.1 type II secretion system F family protein [Oceanobacter sp. 5_MG-2023]MDP2548654.1 type II secretion system F family protein [Oceanobacter sp. 4_MG-2023]
MIDYLGVLLAALVSLISGGLFFFLRDRAWSESCLTIGATEQRSGFHRWQHRMNQRLSTLGIRFGVLLLGTGVFLVAAAVLLAMLTLFPTHYLAATGAATGVVILAVIVMKDGLAFQQNRFEQQLYEAMELMSASLMVGVPITDGLRTVAHSSKGAFRLEMQRVLHRLDGGLSADQSFSLLNQRYPNEGVRAFTAAVDSSWNTGGDPLTLIRSVRNLLKRRLDTRAEIRTGLSSLLSASVFIGLFPYLLILVFQWKDPTWLTLIVEHPKGPTLVVLAVLTQLLGFFWLRYLARQSL